VTIIAWDGRMLAADSSTAIGNTVEARPDSKITVLEDGRAFACTGASSDVQRFRSWMAAGGYPPVLVEPQSFAALLCVPDADPTARVKCFLIEGDSLAYPMEVSGLQAIGAGRDWVLGAMTAMRADAVADYMDAQKDPAAWHPRPHMAFGDEGCAALAVMLACGRNPVYPSVLHACGPIDYAQWRPSEGRWKVGALSTMGAAPE